jgi:hypothetical protein
MDLPPLPTPASIKSITPSFYNVALTCMARAGWQESGVLKSLPAPTGAMLGSCFHAVMAAANLSQMPGGARRITSAKEVFDRKAQQLFAEAHPLIRAKYASPEKFPFYFQRRARAASLAAKAHSERPVGPTPAASPNAGYCGPGAKPPLLVEKTLSSRDGLITGRIDYWNGAASTVTDYKSGQKKDASGTLSESELRQMRLYVYLLRQNGHGASHAAVVRGDGETAAQEVSAAEADSEAQAARLVRDRFNELAAAGESFFAMSSPSSMGCAGCPCIPFCECFWEAAQPAWEAACGTNVEGAIVRADDATVGGTTLRTLALDSSRGTGPRGALVAEQVPVQWLSLGSSIPGAGSVVRVVLAARPATNPKSRIIRVDRMKATTVWRV